MRALVYTQPRCLELQDVPEPELRDGSVLLDVLCTGICGSDVSGFLGHSSRRMPPLVLGHEAVGRVRAVADGVTNVRTGDLVVVNPLQSCGLCSACRSGRANICDGWRLLGMDRESGAFAERIVIGATNVLGLPGDTSLRSAVMVEPLANTVHFMGLAGAGRFQSIALLGGGTQGTLALLLARVLGHRRVAVVETSSARREIAARSGAELVIDPAREDAIDAIRRWTDGRGCDIAIEAVGLAETRNAAVLATRKGGVVIMLGLHDQVSPISFADLVRNEITALGSFAYTPDDFAAAARLLQSGEIDVSERVRIMPLDEGQAAFDILVTDPGDVLKIALAP